MGVRLYIHQHDNPQKDLVERILQAVGEQWAKNYFSSSLYKHSAQLIPDKPIFPAVEEPKVVLSTDKYEPDPDWLKGYHQWQEPQKKLSLWKKLKEWWNREEELEIPWP